VGARVEGVFVGGVGAVEIGTMGEEDRHGAWAGEVKRLAG
jgi:hypothetical protein